MRSPSLLQAQQPAVGFISAADAAAAAAAATRTRATMQIRFSAAELAELNTTNTFVGFCRQVFSKQVCVQPPTSVVNVMLPAFAAERVAAGVEPRVAGAVATERRTPPVPASVIFELLLIKQTKTEKNNKNSD